MSVEVLAVGWFCNWEQRGCAGVARGSGGWRARPCLMFVGLRLHRRRLAVVAGEESVPFVSVRPLDDRCLDPTELAGGRRDLVPLFAADSFFAKDFDALAFLQADLGGVVPVAKTAADSGRHIVFHNFGESAVFDNQVAFGNPTEATDGRANRQPAAGFFAIDFNGVALGQRIGGIEVFAGTAVNGCTAGDDASLIGR